MTPIGHFTFSYLIGNISKKIYLPAILFGGIFPDIEFLLLPLPSFNELHRVITHNLLFVLLSAFAIVFFIKKENRRVFIISFLLGCVFHLLVDASMDANPTNGTGIALLWPFDTRYFLLINLSQPIGISAGWEKPFQMIKALLPDLKWELPIYFIAILILIKKRITIRKGNK